MKKLMNILKYAVCMLYGVFTADMVFRLARFAMAYIDAAEEFPKIIGVAVAAVGDTYSGYMQASVVIVVLLAVMGAVCRSFSAHTLVFLAVNAVSGFVFAAILNLVNLSWSVLLMTAVISFETYTVSCVLCEICVALDVYKNILKNHFGEK